MEQVYNSLSQCSGCAACSYACPKNAIELKEDEYGFRYPKIERDKCVGCKKCIEVCQFQSSSKKNSVIACYAGQNTDESQLMESSSGGIFCLIAGAFLKDNGVVCGATMKFKGDSVEVRHEMIADLDEIISLQGSKYVQSKIDLIYEQIEEVLRAGKKVMFSGTPCQVAAIRRIFSNEYDNILCVDIICHGVPSGKMFQEYINFEERKVGSKITSFTFRDKRRGWGLNGYYTITKKNKHKQINFSPKDSSYYNYFLEGETYRESCYSCPYANTNRVGDITIGDCWGIERFNPEMLSENGGFIKRQQGVSCILINSEKGKEIFEKVKDKIRFSPVRVENVQVINTQLREPAKFSEKRNKILSAYRAKGYIGIDRIYKLETINKKRKRLIKGVKNRIRGCGQLVYKSFSD